MTSPSASRRLAALAAAGALALAAAPAAGAQGTPTQAGGPSLSPGPPVSLGHAKKHRKALRSTGPKAVPRRSSSARRTRSSRLPNTGYDAWAVALLGVGLMAAGVGVRLRTRDVPSS